MLAQMKIQLLEVAKKDVKQRYNDALKAYVTQYFGRPLDKLNSFFDGIQTLVATGVKESEISYQLAYSKQVKQTYCDLNKNKTVRLLSSVLSSVQLLLYF